MTVRTRFPPSPTGMLHIGGARTALFNWLYARRHGGTMVLRIEDTDRERSTDEAVQVILDGMKWLGLTWDEGPYFQTERFPRYRDVVEQLLDEGKAYRCYCTREELDAMRAEQVARREKPRYNGYWRDRRDPPPKGVSPAIRFRNPLEGTVSVPDRIHGHVVFDNAELDDLVIARSDGTPTYNFCVVVDDMDMDITHVIRGDDHLNNTPRQMNILTALGAPVPVYAHLPMILGSDGAKLSKRHGTVSVLQYRDEGYLPEALLNYLVRLGWSHGDQEIFSIEEMTHAFDIEHVQKAAAAVNWDKLAWLNQHYIKGGDTARLAELLAGQFAIEGVLTADLPLLQAIVDAQRERARTLREMALNSMFVFKEVDAYEETAAAKHFTEAGAEALAAIRDGLRAVPEFSAASIHALLDGLASARGVGLGKLAQPLRVALTGTSISPPIDVTVMLIGQERALQRIDSALDHIARRRLTEKTGEG